MGPASVGCERGEDLLIPWCDGLDGLSILGILRFEKKAAVSLGHGQRPKAEFGVFLYYNKRKKYWSDWTPYEWHPDPGRFVAVRVGIGADWGVSEDAEAPGKEVLPQAASGRLRGCIGGSRDGGPS